MRDVQSNQPVALVIEDEAPIRRFLKLMLTEHGYIFREALNGAEGLQKTAFEKPDLVILDLGLPDMDGLEVTKKIREWSAVPIIVLSARMDDKDKVTVLDSGADDYLTKPFSAAELLARLRVALRRSLSVLSGTGEREPSVEFGRVRVDLLHRIIKVAEEQVHLTPIEYKMLVVLIRNAGRVVTHNHLLREIWGDDYSDENHYVRVYMAQLRRKLEEDSARPRYILTEPGVGYRLKVDA